MPHRELLISYGLGFGYDVKQGCRCGQTPRVTAVFEVLGWTVLEGLRSTGIPAAAGILVDATGETIVNSKYGIRYTQGKNSFYGGLFTSLLLESVAMGNRVGAIFAASVRARLPLSPRGPCCGVMFEEEREKRNSEESTSQNQR